MELTIHLQKDGSPFRAKVDGSSEEWVDIIASPGECVALFIPRTRAVEVGAALIAAGAALLERDRGRQEEAKACQTTAPDS